MKLTQSADHNRILVASDLPGDLKELEITIGYVKQPNDGALGQKAVCLDGVIIPEIVRAFNALNK